jgi:hypothetical protein
MIGNRLGEGSKLDLACAQFGFSPRDIRDIEALDKNARDVAAGALDRLIDEIENATFRPR